MPRLIILVATIAVLSVSIGSRDVSVAAAGLGGEGHLGGADSAWHGGNAWHGALVAGTETARGTRARALVAGPQAGDGAERMWGSMTRSLATRSLVIPMPIP